jgi:hypothetical protein
MMTNSQIERQLRLGVNYVKNELRPLLRSARFCAATRRITSADGTIALEWRESDKPRGRVELIQL